ncbi:MAG: hypothetical protein IJ605_07460 [Prevotella sp.]|nr:hypothetical protein [Prevotella sp.]
MRKFVFTTILTSIFGFMLLSCNDESVDINSVNQQTILVYMPWSGTASDNGLYNNFLENLDSIESAIIARKGLAKTRLLVFLSQSASTSKLFEILYDKNQCSRQEIKTYSGTDYTTPEGIATIISDAKNTAEALNYALLVGCHGSGWTFKGDWKDYPYGIAKRHQVRQNGPQADFERTRFFGSVGDLRYATDIESLAEGIRLSGVHMQYILFDDCYMANAEVAYELRQVTNFLIASTSEVMVKGMPYADMWKSLNSQTPDYKSAVDAFYKFYSNYRTPCGTISAIDCRQMDALASVMKQINEHYTFDEAFLVSLQVLDGFNENLFFDMGDYVSKLCTDPYLYEKFTAQLAKTVVSKAATENIYSYIYHNPIYISVETFSGITISDPSRNVVALRGKEHTSWWKATH